MWLFNTVLTHVYSETHCAMCTTLFFSLLVNTFMICLLRVHLLITHSMEVQKDVCSCTQDMPCRLLYEWVVVKANKTGKSWHHAEILQHYLQTKFVAKLNVTVDDVLTVHCATAVCEQGSWYTTSLKHKDHSPRSKRKINKFFEGSKLPCSKLSILNWPHASIADWST